MSTIDLDNVTITYGNFTAVDRLTFTAAPGEVLGILGGNGAGKSSTLRAIAGANPHTSGTITVSGHNLSHPKQAEEARRVLGYCPDVGGLIRQATVREHIALSLALSERQDHWPRAIELAEQFDLIEAFDRPVGGFSHGMCRRLSVLLAILGSTDALVLDEPFDGVDPLGVEATMDAVYAARDAGLTVIISTHLLSLITECSDRILVMNLGRAVSEGPVGQFTGDQGAQKYADLLRGTR